jgi:hypothetical protein
MSFLRPRGRCHQSDREKGWQHSHERSRVFSSNIHTQAVSKQQLVTEELIASFPHLKNEKTSPSRIVKRPSAPLIPRKIQ